jgi:hypothetical protein
MMAEINELITPDAHDTLGRMDSAAFLATARIAQRYGVITRPPDAGAYTHQILEAARK